MKRKGISIVVLLMAVLLLTGCEGKKRGQAGKRNADTNREYIATEPEAEEITMPITFVNDTGDVIYSLQASLADVDDEMREYYDLDLGEYGEDGITIVFNADESADVYEGADAYESLTYESNTQAN